MTSTGNYHVDLGALHCIAVRDGGELIPANGVVRDLPGETWRQSLIACDHSPGESPICFNYRFIEAGGKRVLVDAGWGRGTQRRDGPLLDGLRAEGIGPAGIDWIMLTHGGLTLPRRRARSMA